MRQFLIRRLGLKEFSVLFLWQLHSQILDAEALVEVVLRPLLNEICIKVCIYLVPLLFETEAVLKLETRVEPIS